MRHTSALAVVGLVSCMTLGACSDNEPAATPPASPTPSSSSSATPTPTEPPQSSDEPVQEDEPKLPELAKEHSQSGAKAFVQHFVEVLNQTHESQSSLTLRSLGSKDCEVCGVLGDFVDSKRQAGGYQRGGDWNLLEVQPVGSDGRNELTFITEIQVTPGVSKASAEAPRKRIEARKIFNEFYVSWTDGAWLVDDLRPA